MKRRKTEEKPTLRQLYSTEWGLFLIFGVQKCPKKRDLWHKRGTGCPRSKKCLFLKKGIYCPKIWRKVKVKKWKTQKDDTYFTSPPNFSFPPMRSFPPILPCLPSSPSFHVFSLLLRPHFFIFAWVVPYLHILYLLPSFPCWPLLCSFIRARLCVEHEPQQ